MIVGHGRSGTGKRFFDSNLSIFDLQPNVPNFEKNTWLEGTGFQSCSNKSAFQYDLSWAVFGSFGRFRGGTLRLGESALAFSFYFLLPHPQLMFSTPGKVSETPEIRTLQLHRLAQNYVHSFCRCGKRY